MFQIRFPGKSPWAGTTLACFFCTSCVNDDFLIPEMLNTELRGADIPEGFLDSYQKNFSFIVFSGSNLVEPENYEEKVSFKYLEIVQGDELGSFGKIGGEPEWELGDESPQTYSKNIPMVFLMQIRKNFEFERLPSAAPQMKRNIYGEIVQSDLFYYRLFLSNSIYIFGTDSGAKLKKVYVISQID